MATNVNQVYTQGRERILMGMRFSTVQILKQAIELGVPDADRLRVLLTALRAEAIPRSMRLQMWENIGAAALATLGPAYDNRSHRRPVSSYRQGDDRFSGGALRRALTNPQMYRASPTGLAFINRELLDREARHWARLNFGAGGGGQEKDLTPPGRFPVTGLGMMMGLEPDVRPGFGMPAGFWLGQEGRIPASGDRVGKDQFYLPSSRGGRVGGPRFTRGIAANNFLDAPIQTIASQVKPGLNQLWESARAKQGRDEVLRRKTGRTRLPRTL